VEMLDGQLPSAVDNSLGTDERHLGSAKAPRTENSLNKWHYSHPTPPNSPPLFLLQPRLYFLCVCCIYPFFQFALANMSFGKLYSYPVCSPTLMGAATPR
jgi:hypothetical protein